MVDQNYKSILSAQPAVARWLFIALVLGLLFGLKIQASAQCGTCSTTLTMPSASAQTVNAGQTLCLTGTGSYTGNINLNGGTLCVGTGVTYNPSSTTYNGNWTIHNSGTFSNTTNLTFNSGTSFYNRAGGTISIASSFSIGGTFSNLGTFNLTGNRTLTINSGATVTLGGTTDIDRDIINNGSLTVSGEDITIERDVTNNASGVLTIAGNVTAGRNITNSGSILGGTTSSCNYLRATTTFTNTGTIGGSGQGLTLGNTPGGTVSSPAAVATAPTNQFAAPTLGTSGANITITLTNPGGANPPTHYLLVRRSTSAIATAPTTGVFYDVGDAIGTGTVVAKNPIGTLSLADAPGCGTWNYAAFALDAVGAGCGAYRTTINNASVTYSTVAGSVGGGTTICSGNTSGTLTLSGHSGTVARWESSVSPFSSWTTISHTGTTYTSGALTQTTQFRAVVNGGTGCSNANSTTTTVTVTAATADAGNSLTGCGMGAITMTGATAGGAASLGWTGGAGLGTWAGTGTNPAMYTFTPSVASGSFTATLTVNGTSPCGSVTDTRTISWGTVPAQPTWTNGAICGAGNATFTATPAAGCTIDWYSASTGGTLLASGSNTYVESISVATTRYAQARNTTTGCTSASRSAVNIGVSALPGFTEYRDGNNCGPGPVTISAVPSSGATIDWYAGPTGGSPLLMGNTYYTTPSLSATTVYYAQARVISGGCISSTRISVRAVITTPPTMTLGGGGGYCLNGTVNFTAALTGAVAFEWTGPNGFSSTSQNPSRTNLTFADAGTYNVTGYALSGVNLIYNGDYELGMVGFNSAYTNNQTDLWTEGTYSVIANPQANHSLFSPCGDHTSGSGKQMVVNGAGVAGVSVWNQTVNVDPNTDYQFSYWVQGVYPLAQSELQLYVNGVPAGAVTSPAANITCSWTQFFYNWNSGSSTTAFLSLVNQNVTLSGNDFALDDMIFQPICVTTSSVAITVNTQPTAVSVNGGATQCGGSVVLTASGGTGGSMYYQSTTSNGTSTAFPGSTQTISVVGTGTHYFRSNNGGCWSNQGSASVTINYIPTTVSVTGGGTYCGSATINAANGGSGTIYYQGTTPGGTSTTTPSSTLTTSTNGTYYFRARSPAGCWGTEGSAALIVHPLPTVASTTPAARCGSGTVSLGGTASAGSTLDWYAASTGGSPETGGNGVTSFTTPSLSSTTPYYAEGRNTTTGCVSAARTTVTATINAQPTVASSTPAARCGTGPVGLAGAASSGATLDWYDASSGGGIVTGGTGTTSFTTPSLSTTTTYYLQARNTTTSCISAVRTAIAATINAIPTVASTTPGSNCGTGTVVLSGTASGGGSPTLDWYANSSGGSPMTGGTATTTFTTPSITGNTTYYAQARDGGTGCISTSRTGVLATINARPTVSSTTPGSNCGPGTVNLGGGASGGATLDWYAAASGGSVLTGGTGVTMFTTPSITGNTTYYAEARNSTTGCTSTARTSALATINPLPATVNVTGGGSFCAASATINASNGGGGTMYFQGTTSGGTSTATPATSHSITSTGTYYFRARNTTTGCWSNEGSQTVTLNTANAATVSYASSPMCQATGGTISVTHGGTPGGTYSALPTGLSIDASTGAINVAASAPNSYTITYSMGGACPPASTTATVVLNPNVGTPSTPSGTLSLCQGAAATGYTSTATNATSYTWTVDGTGNSASGTGTTGTMTWAPGYTGTATITVVANGCGGSSAPVTRTVNVQPTGTWLGTTTAWTTAANWCGSVPTVTTDVVIPPGVTLMPIVNGSAAVRNLTIQPGASVTVQTGQSISIAGVITNNGSLTIQPNSTMNFMSASAQPIPPLDYANLTTTGGAKTFSGTTRISGTFTPSASGHTVAGSMIEFNGTGAQNIPAFTFDNLSTSGSSVKSMTGNVTVGGALDMANGLLSIGANVLAMNGTVSGAGTLSGTCSSELQVAGAGGHTGTLNFTPGQNTLGRLGMLKSAAGTVDLGSDVFICTQLTLTEGKIALGGSNLTLLPGASTTDGAPTSYVQTLNQASPAGAGYFIQQMPTGGGQRTFPVGTGTYTPVYLNNTGQTENFKVRAFNGIYENGFSGPPEGNIAASVQRTWEIIPQNTGTTPDVSVRLQWNDADEAATFTTNKSAPVTVYMGRNDCQPGSVWLHQNVTQYNYSSGPYTIFTPSVTSFSAFSVGSSHLLILPVNMGKLRVVANGKANMLVWETYSESNSKSFKVLRSQNGKDFAEIGSVDAARNSGKKLGYSFLDKSPLARTSYYKLLFEGTDPNDRSYSNMVVVSVSAPAWFKAYPNPATDHLNVAANDEEGQAVRFHLIDVQGHVFELPYAEREGGAYQFDISHMATGIYELEKVVDGMIQSKARIVKQ